MARKRIASNELNHNNWEEEDQAEESGNFIKASDEVIKNRIIKVAKRRNPIGSFATSEAEKKGTFSTFTGFAKPAAPATTTFGFLSSITVNQKSENEHKANGLNDISSSTSSLVENKSPLIIGQSEPKKDYYAKLKGLNQSVSKWIRTHVEKNPFLDLTPIFKDYKKYLLEIENLQNKSEKDECKIAPTNTFKIVDDDLEDREANSATVSSSTNITSSKSSEKFEQKPQSFSFDTMTVNSGLCSTSAITFNNANSIPSTSLVKCTFNNGEKPFTFSNVTKPLNSEDLKEDNDDENKPPKVEFTPVIEEDHIYTIRCKVFVKRDQKFGDYGVGNLFLKPVPNKDKVQVIVRADTNLGNLLCNFILSENIPIQKMGKKDVMLVCLPTPDFEPPPIPLLFRVKSPEEADELLKVLEKHKK